MKRKILVVDDVPEVKDLVIETLHDEHDVVGCVGGHDALARLSKERHDLLITGDTLPDMSGEELTALVRDRHAEVVVVAITPYDRLENAGRLLRLGAYDYLEKPFPVEQLRHVVDRALEVGALRRENKMLHSQLTQTETESTLIGNSTVLQHVREKIQLVAGTSATILITGEGGTGKEVVAHEIHRLSDRSHAPFIKVNCASVPVSLLENELFGHEKGAYTGAVKAEPGKLELASSGTILLDEIGELEHTVQTRLLRLIQDGEFERIGRSKPIKVDVRILATTKRDLKEEIRKGRFREDLYYRLNVVPLEMPALRERREDIPLLIEHFVRTFSHKNGKEAISLTDAALRKLGSAYWKGNVRQLQNIIERAVILRSGSTLDADYFQFENEREEQMSRIEHAFRYGSIREMEKLMILNRLKDNNENRTRSAETLDISVRTLRNKLNEYNVPKRNARSGIPAELAPEEASAAHG